ncbi:tubulin epsilon chain-like [Mytilus californianus]|uniref:tubulin epsilon chain-like n=1 Tax=Mytilus californianus TaxID=6549 RepID=UPI0022479087|nr:tubulin epsilon chain-like [Mytilus californianus]
MAYLSLVVTAQHSHIKDVLSSARFEGSLNVDLNEITMKLVPLPKLHYLVASQSPLYTSADVHLPPRKLDQMFSDAFSRDRQLLRADPKHRLYLACALMVRGNVEISDVRRNIERLKPNLKFFNWNQEGWKTGLCAVPLVVNVQLLQRKKAAVVKNNAPSNKTTFEVSIR